MPFRIIPCEGIDLVRFGERRGEIKARLGEPVTFERTQAGAAIDHYLDLGLMLSFDSADRLEFIEVAEPAEIFFGGISLLERSYGSVVSELGRNGVVGVEDAFGIEFRELCFSLFVQAQGEEGTQVEGVSIFAPGYYG